MADPPKLQLTAAQLRAIAGLTRDEHVYRLRDALQPIGRGHLVDRWMAAREAVVDASGAVQDAKLGPGWQLRDLSKPRPPVDEAALAAAQQARAEAEAAEVAAWHRILRLIERAQELRAAPAITPSSTQPASSSSARRA